MQQKKIVFLAAEGESSRWVYNALCRQINIEAAIIEQPVSKKLLFKRRIKKIGFIKTAGQALFSVLLVPFLKKQAAARRAELIAKFQLNNNPFNSVHTHYVPSVNDEACNNLLKELQPDIVVVNGTRIISKKTLQCTKAVFINMHVGITPWYRGSHGGYWALYNNDVKNFGTTIHLVDTGVDTGAVLEQAFVQPDYKDNFTTYPILQAAAGIDALLQVLQRAVAGIYTAVPHSAKGKMYYQPTIWQYLCKREKPRK